MVPFRRTQVGHYKQDLFLEAVIPFQVSDFILLAHSILMKILHFCTPKDTVSSADQLSMQTCANIPQSALCYLSKRRSYRKQSKNEYSFNTSAICNSSLCCIISVPKHKLNSHFLFYTISQKKYQ
jgi:hypothetical protein